MLNIILDVFKAVYVMQRMVVLSSGRSITVDSIPEYITEGIDIVEERVKDSYDLEGLVENLER